MSPRDDDVAVHTHKHTYTRSREKMQILIGQANGGPQAIVLILDNYQTTDTHRALCIFIFM